MKQVMTRVEALKKREDLFSWFKKYTFGKCSNVEKIIVTRNTVQHFIAHNPALGIGHRYEEQPQGYEVYCGFGLLIVDLGEFRLVFIDET